MLNVQRPTSKSERIALLFLLLLESYSDFIGCGFSTFAPHFLQVRRLSSFQKSSMAWLKCSTISAQSKWISSTNEPQFSQ